MPELGAHSHSARSYPSIWDSVLQPNVPAEPIKRERDLDQGDTRFYMQQVVADNFRLRMEVDRLQSELTMVQSHLGSPLPITLPPRAPTPREHFLDALTTPLVPILFGMVAAIFMLVGILMGGGGR